MLTNTAKTAPFDHRHTHPILGKKTQYFKCSQWDQVESDFILSFIHLHVRKMYFNAFLITLCSKIDSIWVCSSGPVMDSPHDLIEFIKNIFSDSFCTSWKLCSYQNYEIKNGGHRARLCSVVEDVRNVRTTFCPLFHFWVRTGASFYEIPIETLDRRSNVHGRNQRKSDICDISL